ncbi:Golgin subfamily A member 7/ERF4 family-domain-containing protein [Podospora appendiculata]|uniref:Ras modification protein ERF4 n=1 Tax=Podospora appendiculata TaxID=314037 RepID=A0AAE1CFS8_9PEZI|nr:Golgin subfamily A member 7/ERF4 family-domain-containing protein [Podospora appendiculata]
MQQARHGYDLRPVPDQHCQLLLLRLLQECRSALHPGKKPELRIAHRDLHQRLHLHRNLPSPTGSFSRPDVRESTASPRRKLKQELQLSKSRGRQSRLPGPCDGNDLPRPKRPRDLPAARAHQRLRSVKHEDEDKGGEEAVSAAATDRSSRRLPARHRQPTPRNRLKRPPLLRGDSYLTSPFRTRGAAASFQAGGFQRPLRRLSVARLWNPTNSTPRISPTPTSTSTPARKRRPSTPPPPSIPLSLPAFDITTEPILGTGAGDYPLLTLPEQQAKRQSISNRASLQIGRSTRSEQRVNLPRTVRYSHDEKRLSVTPSPIEEPKEPEAGPSYTQPARQRLGPRTSGARRRGQSASLPNAPVGLSFRPGTISIDHANEGADKGKGKAVMAPQETEGNDGRAGYSQDLERGPGATNQRHSTASRLSGIGSAISSSDSSIMGDPDQQADLGEEWGPQHPCYPHLNPHVPVDSPEYANTRIIRIRRDWLLEGDLAPTFSNLYPEILDPAGVTEQEFRRVIDKLNGELIPAFNPYNWRNVVDGMLGLATGWLWDDFGLTGVKSRLRSLEKWIEQWNLEMEKVCSDENVIPPRIISLRRTGYMTLDIQIPDPEIAPAPPSTRDGASRSGMPAEPAAALTT